MTIGTASTLSLQNASVTNISGTITNMGTIAMNSAGNVTELVATGATTTLSGGTVSMSNNIENFIFGAAGTNVLVVPSGATIQGAGFVGDNQLTLTNQGTIDANVSHTLTVEASGGTTNTGTLEATAGGSLHLVGGFTNTGGSILADGSGSVVELSGATITGGTLTTTNTGTIQNSGTATLNGVTIGTASTLSLQNGVRHKHQRHDHQHGHDRHELRRQRHRAGSLPGPRRR